MTERKPDYWNDKLDRLLGIKRPVEGSNVQTGNSTKPKEK